MVDHHHADGTATGRIKTGKPLPAWPCIHPHIWFLPQIGQNFPEDEILPPQWMQNRDGAVEPSGPVVDGRILRGEKAGRSIMIRIVPSRGVPSRGGLCLTGRSI
jgi:hypothetical protein